MRNLILTLTIGAILAATGCKKSHDKPGNSGYGSNGGLAFANTEFQGTFSEASRYYPKPISIDFYADSTVAVFGDFYLYVNGGPYEPDSIGGKVIDVSTDANGLMTVAVYTAQLADTEVYTMPADLSSLNGGSKGASIFTVASNQFYLWGGAWRMTKPIPAVSGFWTTDTSKAADATFGQPYSPDIDGLSFSSNGVSYDRGGNTVNNGELNNYSIYYTPYRQVNGRLYFYGYNEDYGQPVEYFGVFTPGGDTLFADTREFNYARVTTIDQSVNIYGPSESTPTAYKKTKD